MSPSQEIIFIDLDLSLQRQCENRTIMEYASSAMKCVEQVSKSLQWIVASNCYKILDEVPKSTRIRLWLIMHGVFFSRERYSLELVRVINYQARCHDT